MPQVKRERVVNHRATFSFEKISPKGAEDPEKNMSIETVALEIRDNLKYDNKETQYSERQTLKRLNAKR